MCVHVYVYVCVCWCFLTSVHYVVCDAGRLFTHAILIILSQIAALYFPLLAAVCVCLCIFYSYAISQFSRSTELIFNYVRVIQSCHFLF